MRTPILTSIAAAAIACFALAASAEEVTYRKHIKPLFDAKCIKCHGADAAPELGDFKENKDKWMSKGKGMRMDTYSHLLYYVTWPDTGAIMRRLDDGKNTKDGEPGNMHEFLGDTDVERAKNLALFKDWIGPWSLKRPKDAAKDEIEAIKAKY